MSKNLLTAALMTDVQIAVTDVRNRTITGKVMGIQREGGKDLYNVTVLNSNGLTTVCVRVGAVTVKTPPPVPAKPFIRIGK